MMRSSPGPAGGASSGSDAYGSEPPAETKSRKPKDTPFRQQRIKSWLPILQPTLVSCIFLAIGVVFIPVGKWFNDQSEKVVEYSVRYDGDGADVTGCEISDSNEGRNCTVAFDIDEDMEPPIYLYYELGNFFQNHRRYVKSRSASQLLGQTVEADADCDPLQTVEVGGVELDLNPCGLIANSMFNDIIKVTNAPAPFDGSDSTSFMKEDLITWAVDRDTRFSQPDDFSYVEVGSTACPTAATSCVTCFGGDSTYANCNDYTDSSGAQFKYWYPDDDEVQYLYETYPDVVSPIEGVLNEHFMVWMRTAGLPTFRKVYGRIPTELAAGDTVELSVTANFFVGSFDGTKTLVLSTVSSMGGRNPYLGLAYVVLGSVSLAVGVAFAVKHYLQPRRLGDTKFLVWKDTAM